MGLDEEFPAQDAGKQKPPDDPGNSTVNFRGGKRSNEAHFGWLKTVANFRKTRFRGIERTQLAAHLNGAAYNLLRIAKLTAA
jgi:IS5 family transposase